MPTRAERLKNGPPYKRGPYRNAGEVIEPTDPLVAAILKRAQQLGWSDEKLAKRAGYERSTIYYIRTGRTTGKLSTIRVLAQAVGYDIKLVLRADAPKLPKAAYAGAEEVESAEA